MSSTPLLDELEQSAAAEQGGRFVALPLEDGSYFQLRHLPWRAIAALEREHGLSWLVIVDAPQVNGAVLAQLAIEVAIAADQEPPKIDTVADVIRISESLVIVDDSGNLVGAAQSPTEAGAAPPLSWTAPPR